MWLEFGSFAWLDDPPCLACGNININIQHTRKPPPPPKKTQQALERAILPQHLTAKDVTMLAGLFLPLSSSSSSAADGVRVAYIWI
jgi:hypothetical protein